MQTPIKLNIGGLPKTGQVVDPVCKMTIDPKTSAGSSIYKGVTYYFCALHCKEKFDADPEVYAGKKAKEKVLAEAPAPKGTSKTRLCLYIKPPDAGRLAVGFLSCDSGEFVFRYTEEFRRQSDIPAVSAFPDKNREYRSQTLWPVFQVRIPPTDRPDIERLVEEKNLDTNDPLRLLSELGKRAFSTPYEFVLEPRP